MFSQTGSAADLDLDMDGVPVWSSDVGRVYSDLIIFCSSSWDLLCIQPVLFRLQNDIVTLVYLFLLSGVIVSCYLFVLTCRWRHFSGLPLSISHTRLNLLTHITRGPFTLLPTCKKSHFVCLCLCVWR